MKLTVPLLIFLLFCPFYSNCKRNLMVRIVKTISEVHHFGFYMIMCSDTESDKLLHENLVKILHSELGFAAIVNFDIDRVDTLRKRVKEVTRQRSSNIEIKSLKIFNGGDEISRKKFADFSQQENFGGRDVWLLFLDGKVSLERYLSTVVLPFNSQLIIGVIQNSKHVNFKAPYRVADDFPLRITDVGSWTEAGGLDLPIVDVAHTRKDFEGFQLRAGTWDYSPVTIVRHGDDGKIWIDGYVADIWIELSQKLNFTYIYHLSRDNCSGSISPNGTWNGLIDMLIKDEIDIAVVQLSLTSDRIAVVDFSVPIISSSDGIFYQDTSNNHFEWGNLFRPLHTEVWLVILLSYVVITVTLAFFHAIGCSYNLENYLFKQEYTILGCLLIVFRAFTNQGSDLTPESSPGRIVLNSAYLTMAVILPSYSAALISYLTIQTPYKPFDSLETMLTAKTHMLATVLGTDDYNYFSEARSPIKKEIYKTLIKPLEEAGRLPPDPVKGIDLVCSNKDIAFFGNYMRNRMLAEEVFLKRGCKIISLENPVANVDECFGFQKGSPYALMINLELQKMIFTGLLRRFEKQVYWRKKFNFDSGSERIHFRHVIEIYYLLLGGYFLSMVFFTIEVFCVRRKNFEVVKKIIE